MSESSRLEYLLDRGGSLRVDLLRFAVLSAAMEPVILFLIREYRLRPTVAGALAIYDSFCAPHAAARVDASPVLPVRDVRLSGAIEQLRSQSIAYAEAQAQAVAQEDERPGLQPPMAERGLFDSLADLLWSDGGSLRVIENDYDENLTPEQNLPDGSASQAQLNFVNQVWRPRIKPLLVAAGFWQFSSID